MKISTRTISTLLLSASLTASMAQDTLITKSGDVLKVYGVESSPSSIFYRLSEGANAAIERINIEDVLMIKKADGTQQNFYDTAAAQPQPTQVVQATPPPAEQQQSGKSLPDEQRNSEILESLNTPTPIYEGKVGQPSKSAICQFFATDDSVLANQDIEVKISLSSWQYYQKQWKHKDLPDSASVGTRKLGLQISIKNKTDRMMFIDLANTFHILGEISKPYYVPTATSTTSGGTTGMSVNLGGGVGVGGSKSKFTTNVEYSQRVVSIPPHATKKIDPIMFAADGVTFKIDDSARFAVVGAENTYYAGETLIYKYGRDKLTSGDIIEFDDATQSEFKWGHFISYSFDEALSSLQSIKSSFYLKRMVIPSINNPIGTATMAELDLMLNILNVSPICCYIDFLQTKNKEKQPSSAMSSGGMKRQ